MEQKMGLRPRRYYWAALGRAHLRTFMVPWNDLILGMDASMPPGGKESGGREVLAASPYPVAL